MKRKKSVKIETLVEYADAGYSDDNILMQYLRDPRADHGDTLAKFVVLELAETFDPDATAEAQINEAVRVIRNAVSQLEGVLEKLHVLYHVVVSNPVKEKS
jgi:hypothetical protein